MRNVSGVVGGGVRAAALGAAILGGLGAASVLPLPDGLSVAGVARAAEAVVAFDRAEDRERYERLLHDYRCLKCQNQSIADSGASLADDLRVQIRDRVVAGDDDAAIDEYLVSRYGEFVRYRPRFGAATAVLWIGPFALLAVGLGAGVFMARRNAALAADAAHGAGPHGRAGAGGEDGGGRTDGRAGGEADERDRLAEARRLLR